MRSGQKGVPLFLTPQRRSHKRWGCLWIKRQVYISMYKAGLIYELQVLYGTIMQEIPVCNMLTKLNKNNSAAIECSDWCARSSIPSPFGCGVQRHYQFDVSVDLTVLSLHSGEHEVVGLAFSRNQDKGFHGKKMWYKCVLCPEKASYSTPGFSKVTAAKTGQCCDHCQFTKSAFHDQQREPERLVD